MVRLLRSCTGMLLVWMLVTAHAHANMGADESESSNPNYQEGKKALAAQDWKKAIGLLTQAVQSEPGNSDAHSLLGYAYRKSGNLDASFAQYGEALKLDPSNRHAHEYVGEAYLMVDNLPKAEQHLAELQRLCSPIPCEELKELKRAVDAYKAAKKK
ncbi:MAG TPA: tetratricopeptide repeat protein [Burkholderiales bacterium]|nr:tetratricopeptide repeat protein [Burkholderiales bacterium]